MARLADRISGFFVPVVFAFAVGTFGMWLGSGADVSFGFYLERPSYLSLALVTCSPNRGNPELRCPLA